VQLCESAAFFDELTRDNRDELLVRQDEGGRPTRWRRARYVPAVEYIQANRVRTMLMEAMDRALAEVDVVVAPTFEQNIVLLTNVTGHPVVCVPNGVRQSDKMAVSISFLGRVYGEAETLALAKAYQDATGFHNQRPPLFSGRSGAGR
jgi:Asp-tRNA(Asn)/Glu-tRNA(Gln) amidotransferase A subunit family amidase